MGLRTELGIRPPGRSPAGRAIRWTAGTTPGAWVLARTLRHLDRATLALTRGRITVSDGLAGVPSVFLTTTGARTGQPRTTQLVAVPFGDDDLAVIGSNFGHRSKHPGWVHNLAADPHCTAGYGERRAPVVAREVTGAEAEQVWASGRAVYRGFATYPAMAGERQIRVFVLEPAAR